MTHKEKLRLAGIKRYGSEKAWREALAKGGRKGGKSPKTKPSGFAAMSPEKRREAAHKGLEKRWGKRGDKE